MNYIIDLRKKNKNELVIELKKLLKQKFILRIQLKTEQATKHSKLRTVRRNIARIKTILNEKRLNNHAN